MLDKTILTLSSHDPVGRRVIKHWCDLLGQQITWSSQVTGA